LSDLLSVMNSTKAQQFNKMDFFCSTNAQQNLRVLSLLSVLLRC